MLRAAVAAEWTRAGEDFLESSTRQLEQLLAATVAAAIRRTEREAAEELAAAIASTESRVRQQRSAELAQALRRFRQAGSPEEIMRWLEEAAGSVCGRFAILSVSGPILVGLAIHGVDSEPLQALFEVLDLPLAEAPALSECVESREMVVSITTPREVSPQLVQIFQHGGGEKVYLFPIVVRGETAAVLYGASQESGPVDFSSLELLTGMAGIATDALLTVAPTRVPAPAPDNGLISIEGVSLTPKPRKVESLPWSSLSPEERQLHLSARRFARVQVAEMRLEQAEAVQKGRRRHNLYGELKGVIDEARETFRQRFVAASSTMVDYLHVELVQSLAQDHVEMLGTGYPGPVV